MRSATATPAPSIRELKSAAVQQTLSRRTAPEFRTFDGPTGPTRIQTGGDELKTPATLAEWADRVITGTPDDAVGGALIVILSAAAQGGARTAVAAVSVAERLSEWDQWLAWNSLARMQGGLPDVDAVLAEVRREWRRLKLATSMPLQPLVLETNRPVFASAAGGTAYSPSVPPHMIPSWVTR